MGFTNIMATQENPDGLAGHKEREEFQEISKQGEPKRKFTRGKDTHEYTVQHVDGGRYNRMKEDCDDWTPRCRPGKCALCVKREYRIREIVGKAKKIISYYEGVIG